MFCHKCGKQMVEGAMFCSFCGERLQNTILKNEQSIIPTTNNEYNRNAIKIYLNNLLQLEAANQALEHELTRLNDEYVYIKNNNYYATYVLLDHLKEDRVVDECCHLYYDGKETYIAVWMPYNTPIYMERYLKKS